MEKKFTAEFFEFIENIGSLIDDSGKCSLLLKENSRELKDIYERLIKDLQMQTNVTLEDKLKEYLADEMSFYNRVFSDQKIAEIKLFDAAEIILESLSKYLNHWSVDILQELLKLQKCFLKAEIFY